MKLIIDIPEQIYLNAKADILCGGEILVKAIKNGIPHETVTEFADRCRECGAKYGKLLKQEQSGDLISRDAVLDIIHLFFTEEVDKIPTKKTEDGEVYVIHKCQPLFEMNKAICKRIKALPSASPTQNCVGNALDVRCDDAISRKELLKAIDTWDKFGVDDTNSLFRLDNLSLPHYVPYIHYDDVVKCIKGMPSVNPQEPKTGHCKDCKYFEYDSLAKVDGISLIFAHENCKRWGDGCKTKEDGYCFLFEPKESER